jgi:hypothetical protein
MLHPESTKTGGTSLLHPAVRKPEGISLMHSAARKSRRNFTFVCNIKEHPGKNFIIARKIRKNSSI